MFDINEYTFIVWDANGKSDTWKVYYFDNKPPECESGIFISSKVCFNIIFSLFFIKYLQIFYSYYCKLKIPYRFIFTTYRECSSSHNIIRLFKHNKNLNKRWNTCNHPFYENILNGNIIPEMISLFENNSLNEIESVKTIPVQGKYHQQ